MSDDTRDDYDGRPPRRPTAKLGPFLVVMLVLVGLAAAGCVGLGVLGLVR